MNVRHAWLVGRLGSACNILKALHMAASSLLQHFFSSTQFLCSSFQSGVVSQAVLQSHVGPHLSRGGLGAFSFNIPWERIGP